MQFLLLGTLLAIAGPAQGAAPTAPPRARAQASPPPGFAAEPAPTPEAARAFAQARAHFDAGTDHYAAGRYEEAIRAFQAGYALVPRPNFLVNIGQAYRKLGQLERAKEAYVAYVRALPMNSAIRDQALQVLAEIEVQLHDGQDPKPVRTAVPAAPPVAPPPVVPAAVTPPAPKSSRAATWLGLGTGGIGLALVATGAGFQLRARSASDELAEASRIGAAFDPAEERAGKRAEKVGNGLFAAGGAVMAAGLLLFLVVDAATSDRASAKRPDVAFAPDGATLRWRF